MREAVGAGWVLDRRFAVWAKAKCLRSFRSAPRHGSTAGRDPMFGAPDRPGLGGLGRGVGAGEEDRGGALAGWVWLHGSVGEKRCFPECNLRTIENACRKHAEAHPQKTHTEYAGQRERVRRVFVVRSQYIGNLAQKASKRIREKHEIFPRSMRNGFAEQTHGTHRAFAAHSGCCRSQGSFRHNPFVHPEQARFGVLPFDVVMFIRFVLRCRLCNWLGSLDVGCAGCCNLLFPLLSPYAHQFGAVDMLRDCLLFEVGIGSVASLVHGCC